MPKPQAKIYRTTNWRDYNQSLKQRGSMLLWIDKEMDWLAAGSGKRGWAEKSPRIGWAMPRLPDFLNQIPDEERIESVSGDGAYDTKKSQTRLPSGTPSPGKKIPRVLAS